MPNKLSVGFKNAEIDAYSETLKKFQKSFYKKVVSTKEQ
jgi:hypothetical protein